MLTIIPNAKAMNYDKLIDFLNKRKNIELNRFKQRGNKNIKDIEYRVKPHHPKTFGWCFCRRVPRFQLRPNDRLPSLTIRPKPEFLTLKRQIHFLD